MQERSLSIIYFVTHKSNLQYSDGTIMVLPPVRNYPASTNSIESFNNQQFDQLVTDSGNMYGRLSQLSHLLNALVILP